jgi:hypothetical protein
MKNKKVPTMVIFFLSVYEKLYNLSTASRHLHIADTDLTIPQLLRVLFSAHDHVYPSIDQLILNAQLVADQISQTDH